MTRARWGATNLPDNGKKEPTNRNRCDGRVFVSNRPGGQLICQDQGSFKVNSLIYLVGLIVIVLVILPFIGLA